MSTEVTDRLLALFYTPFFNRAAELPPVDGVDWTHDRRKLGLADVVIVHLPNCKPGFRTRRYPLQSWVGWSLESTVNYPLMADRQFMRQFDLRMTYERNADVWTPYLPLPDEWERIRAAPIALQQEGAPVVAFISNGDDRMGRAQLLAELLRYVPIDCYGRLFNNRQLPADDGGGLSKRRAVARYPFCIAFENSSAPDYVTEKIYDALSAGSIPVYRGAPNVAEFVPPGSYIDAAAYGSARELGTYLNYLAQHPEAAARYHEWRRQPLPRALLERAAAVKVEPFQRLLELCRARRGGGPTRRQLSALRRVGDEVGVRLRRAVGAG